MQSQQRLGWTNFVFGRWHTQWATAQHNYLLSTGSKISLKRWITAIIYKLYMIAWDLWDHRNKVLHAPDGPKAALEIAHLTNHITHEYAQGQDGLRALDSHLFRDPLPMILAGTRSSQRKWLRSVRLARELVPNDPEAAARMQMQRQQALMRRWLQPPNNNYPP